MERLSPPPGDYQTPLMQMARVMGSEDPQVIRLQFRAETTSQGQTHELTIAVPISTLDATGLLRSLKMLQEKGLIPYVPEANQTKN